MLTCICFQPSSYVYRLQKSGNGGDDDTEAEAGAQTGCGAVGLLLLFGVVVAVAAGSSRGGHTGGGGVGKLDEFGVVNEGGAHAGAVGAGRDIVLAGASDKVDSSALLEAIG